MTSAREYDYVIVGGGIIGLAVARELKQQEPAATIALLEKETDVAQHASGRNSGVLHAGFYYTADSLKARFTREGNREMRAYCEERGLKINPCGKLVVASSSEEVKGLEELKRRAEVNQVELNWVDEAEMLRIEPMARSYGGKALYSPTTASVDPKEVCRTLKAELEAAGVDFHFSIAYRGRGGAGEIRTSRGVFKARKFINCAGLYADRIAKDWGFARDLVIVPFKGIYLKYSGDRLLLKTHIYPVPNLANPFLGVHFTITADGVIKIGPTAIPAFWRENYSGWSRFRLGEFMRVFWCELKLFVSNSFGFRNLAREEFRKYRKSYFKSLAAKMVSGMDSDGFKHWSIPGIRAQLMDQRTSKLVHDFVIQGDASSIHVLNAVSPAFTCSFPVARHVVAELKRFASR